MERAASLSGTEGLPRSGLVYSGRRHTASSGGAKYKKGTRVDDSHIVHEYHHRLHGQSAGIHVSP